MDEHSARLIAMIEDACHRFRAGHISLLDLQSSVDGVASGLEQNVGDAALRALQHFDGALEHILYMCPAEEQRARANHEVDMLLEILSKQRAQSKAKQK